MKDNDTITSIHTDDLINIDGDSTTWRVATTNHRWTVLRTVSGKTHILSTKDLATKRIVHVD